ncbi:MAG: SIMPL domain-containing protein [Candidatus Saganbacteria bacterium]|nr:SIMPL domain-containing protein [Candidatus Saganbacteria bacterium]
MQKTVAALLCLLFLAGSGQAAPLKGEATDLTITGQGEIKVPPDIAHISIGVERTEKTAVEAQQTVASKMSAILSSLEKLGLNRDEIKTSQASLYPQYKYDRGERDLIGYTARNEIDVTVTELTELGKTIDTAISAGATNINHVTFGLKSDAPVKKAALQQAFTEAKGKAEIIAAAAGLTIIGIKSIRETGAQVVPQVNRSIAFAADGRGGGRSETPISLGKVEVRGSLTVVYEAKEK